MHVRILLAVRSVTSTGARSCRAAGPGTAGPGTAPEVPVHLHRRLPSGGVRALLSGSAGSVALQRHNSHILLSLV